ncbi:MAG: hypothetical protein MUC49_16630 [Raineya sp.]|jgi:hypothetical protein|nr:hypothetical protein [Raineya sp.]
MDEYLNRILKAKDEIDYNLKKMELKAIIEKGFQNILNVESLDDFYDFCINFMKTNSFSSPIYIEGDILEKTPHDFIQLEKLNYPSDFLQWHKNYGHIPIKLGFIRINPTKKVLENLENDDLLTTHNFLNITRDRGGDAYVYDMNGEKPQIKRINHTTCYSTSDILDELYSEYYDFWYDEDIEKYHNPKKLDVKKIYDENNEFATNSIYIKQYLLEDEESIKNVNVNNFLEFLILKAKEAFNDILEDINNK